MEKKQILLEKLSLGAPQTLAQKNQYHHVGTATIRGVTRKLKNLRAQGKKGDISWGLFWGDWQHKAGLENAALRHNGSWD